MPRVGSEKSRYGPILETAGTPHQPGQWGAAMELDQAARLLVGIFAVVGLVVCLCGGLVACAWCVGTARQRMRRLDATWRHEQAIAEAITDWKARNPERMAELARLRERCDG